MDAKVTKSSPKEVSLIITKSDIGTLYIVQHELLKEPSIEFAGVIMKHPLTKEYWMRVNTSKGNPLKEIEKAAKTALEYMDELKKVVNSKLKGV
jgi:DNA-directed RNA polymerase subunit L